MTAPDSSLVMSSRLAMKRLSRSDSSMMVARSSVFSRVVERAGEIAQRAGGAEDGGERRLQVVGDRGEQRRAQPVGFGMVRSARSMSSTRRTRSIASAAWSIRASSSRRWSGVSSGPGLSLSMPTTPIGAAAGAHRQEQPFGARQRVGAAPGRAVVFPGPFGGGEVGLVERVFGRIAGLARRSCPVRAAAARRGP